MKKIVLVFSAILLVLVVSGCGRKDTIKIGFIGPMTGDAANYGKLMSQAVKIAVDERNSKGGIGGYRIQLIAEDDEGKVEKANAAIEKLAGVDKILGFVGPVFSSCALAVAPKAQIEKIVMISPSSTHKALTSLGNFIFRDVLSDELQAIVFAKYTYEVLGLRKIAVLHLKNDYSQGLAEDFKTQFEKEGGKVVAMESGMQNDKDFKTQLTKIKGTKPEALYMPDYVSEIAQILDQAKQLGLQTKMLSSDGFSNPEIFELAGDLANGVIFANSAEDTIEASPVKADFSVKYYQKWKQKPDAFSLNSYDAANIILNAVEQVYKESSPEEKKTLNLNRDRIREIVAATANYNGASGIITFRSDKGDAIKDVGIFTSESNSYRQIAAYRVENDKLVEVK